MESTPPIRNIALYFILHYFSSLSVSTVMSPSVILDVALSAAQCWPGIWSWCITVFFISPMISIMPLSSILFCVSRIVGGKENSSPYDVLDASLKIFGTIISILNWSSRIPLTKVFKFLCLKGLYDVNQFKISGVDGVKESKNEKWGVDVTELITYKIPFAKNWQPVTVYLALVEVVEWNTIFLSPIIQTIKSLIINKNNTLVSGILEEQFKMEMMVPKIFKEAPKTS